MKISDKQFTGAASRVTKAQATKSDAEARAGDLVKQHQELTRVMSDLQADHNKLLADLSLIHI